MYQDHRAVVGTAGPVADRQQELAELLDREILPCLERPGRLLGPFDLPSATVTGEMKLALVWPSIAEGAHAPAALRPLLVSLPNPRPFSLCLGSVPSPRLRAALRLHGQPAFSRPDWAPLADADLWLVWLDYPLQLTGLLGLLQDSGIAARAVGRSNAPRIVVAGPAARRVSGLVRVYADALLPDLTGLDAAAWSVIGKAAEIHDNWMQTLGSLGEVLGPIEAPQEALPSPTQPASHDQQGPESRPAQDAVTTLGELATGPGFLCRADWREVGRGRAYTDHIVVGAGSAALRERHGVDPCGDLVTRVAASLGQETASLCLHFVRGLAGETAADHQAIADFVNTVVGAAPRGARQVSVRLHEQVVEHCPTAAELTLAPGRLVASIREQIRARRVDLQGATDGSALIEALLADGPDRAPLLEYVVGCGGDDPESLVATDLQVWRSALEQTAGVGTASAAATETALEDIDPLPTGLPEGFCVQAPQSVSPVAIRKRKVRSSRTRADRWTRWRSLVPLKFDYRIEYAKEGRLRFLGPSELSEVLLGACERARIPVSMTGVVQPRPRVGYGPSLGAGIAGDREYFDLSLERKIDDLGRRLCSELPDQIRLLAAEFMPRCSPQMQLSRVALAEYEAEIEAGHHGDPADREQDIARIRQWSRRIAEGLPAEAGTDDDPIHQLSAIRWNAAQQGTARLEFTLDLRREGARCKPREVVSRALTGLSVDARLIPMRRRRLLVFDDSLGRATLHTPLEQVRLARRRQRAFERSWAE
ncbi:hypothetical protein DRQ53_10430 [bacterium]|nr:MAG: hypothetical protein DRQ32_01915 [bacterium]RKZ14897.1 MAG: hypothetical protein DRQ53_10430 [bacterium]